MCDVSNGRVRTALVAAFQYQLGYVHHTEVKCGSTISRMLGQVRGIICPERTRKDFIRGAAGADTSSGSSEIKICMRNTIKILGLIYKLNGKRQLWDSIHNRKARRSRDADSRARRLTLQMCALTNHEACRRVLQMKRTMATGKTFNPTPYGSSSPCRTLDWFAWYCLDFSFYIGLTKQGVLEMLTQVHRNGATWKLSGGPRNGVTVPRTAAHGGGLVQNVGPCSNRGTAQPSLPKNSWNDVGSR